MFEVSKNETSDSPPSSSLPNNVPVRNNAIKVTLPNELEGVSYIQVSIQNGKNGFTISFISILKLTLWNLPLYNSQFSKVHYSVCNVNKRNHS